MPQLSGFTIGIETEKGTEKKGREGQLSLVLCACLLSKIHGANLRELRSPTVKLNSGYDIPIAGYGTHFRTPVEEIEAVSNALDVGYRLFDTAWVYKNEQNVGVALKKWFDAGGKREELFISTKLPACGMRASDVEIYLNDSLKKLGLSYVDMYLIHDPFGLNRLANLDEHIFENGTADLDMTTDIEAVWKAMEKQVEAGRTKSIGFSNFNETQIMRIWNIAEIKPSNLHVEANVYIQQEGLLKLARELGITVTAYSPLGSSDTSGPRRRRDVTLTDLPTPMEHPTVIKIAEKHKKTPAQILLNYVANLGFVVIPKSKHLERMRENLDIFNFNLTDEDVNELKSLDQHGKFRKFTFQVILPGCYKHPEYPFADRIPKTD
ncbi:hypothetical protein QAD02_023717 [Eretmocerus hayati]|uniref:Uncharacterized protein n=1 Tax=Eretmocerus hayati TaxID=131215 RepID=A0ACC2PWS4_9HYME|nr:hypothetical protein QAD02_023717 [Eretmocerus hayati]